MTCVTLTRAPLLPAAMEDQFYLWKFSRKDHEGTHLKTAREVFRESDAESELIMEGKTLRNNTRMPFPKKLNKLSREVLRKLATVSSTKGFLDLFRLQVKEVSSEPTFEKMTKPGQSQSSVPLAEEAPVGFCTAEKTLVKLNLPEASNVMYFPTCVRLERCSGCCYSKRLACKPTAVDPVRLKVIKVVNSRVEHIMIDQFRHKSCSCSCRLTEDNCNREVHDYDPNTCKCVCRNYDAKARCTFPTHFWLEDKCQCVCAKTEECFRGYFFNTRTCRCEVPYTTEKLARIPAYTNSFARTSNVTGSIYQPKHISKSTRGLLRQKRY